MVEQVLGSVAQPQAEGACGDSGRLSKEEQQASKRYRPDMDLELLADLQGPAVQQLVSWVDDWVRQRQRQARQGEGQQPLEQGTQQQQQQPPPQPGEQVGQAVNP